MTRSNNKYRTAMVVPTPSDSIREAHSYEYDNNGNILYDFVYAWKFSEGHAGEGEESREMVETMKALRKVQGEAGGDCGGIKYSMGEGVKGYVKGGKAYVWWPTIATAQPRQQPELLQAYKRNEKKAT